MFIIISYIFAVCLLNYVSQLSFLKEKVSKGFHIERAQKTFTHLTHFLIRRVIFIVVIIVILKQMKLVFEPYRIAH